MWRPREATGGAAVPPAARAGVTPRSEGHASAADEGQEGLGEDPAGGWRATLPVEVAAGASGARARRATPETIASRVEALGLWGALGQGALDKWGAEGPSVTAEATVQRLRVAARARVLEATAVGRTATALEWFGDFLASTERTPFLDPAEPGGARYNSHTLVLFAEFVRQCGSRHKGRA
eukprot:3630139-Pleurochrysis_carterae.AAC.1